MEFNKITRGNKRQVNDEKTVYEILDAGFLCHIAFRMKGQTMIIPTAYGRKENIIYIHGSSKNGMMNEIINTQMISISVTHLDGIVLARTLFDTSANYRSVVLFGKATEVIDEAERIEALKIITDNIIEGRWNEVPIGNENELKATMVVKIKIESASAKVRNVGPMGDEEKTNEVWSGVIPLQLKATEPVQDKKFGKELPLSFSVKKYYEQNK